MKDYNYLESMIEDIVNYIKDNNITDLDYDKLYEELWCEDCITGNGGMYYATEYECESFLCHNWSLIGEALRGFCVPYDNLIDKDAQYFDSLVRCYLLGEALDSALEVIKNEDSKICE